MPQYQGVWSLQQQMQALTSGQWATDPLFDYTTLLLQADDAANSAQNNTFLDSSTNSFAITRNGNTTQGSFSPFSQAPGYWSNYFADGSSSYLTLSSGPTFGSGDYTLEFFAYKTTSWTDGFDFLDAATSGLALYVSSGTMAVTKQNVGGTAIVLGSLTTLSPNAWYHFAIVRSSGSVRCYVNGSPLQAAVSDANNYSVATTKICGTGDGYFDGYISNMRLATSALYSIAGSLITVPTSPLTTATGVQYIGSQSNRFVDTTGTQTVAVGGGTPSVQAFSPFAPQFQYTASGTGGSGYFDGTTDYLSVANNTALELGSSDFTIECWVYPTGGSGAGRDVICKRSAGGSTFGGYSLYLDTSNNFGFVADDNTSTPWAVSITGTAVTLNQWTHIAVTRSGSTWTLWRNGVSAGTATSSITINTAATSVGIGAVANGDQPFTGYISGARIVKGTAVYTAAFTPPTAPLTAITNTSLLLNFTNAGILDGTMKNNLETVADAKVSTSVVKYGSGSLAFDGTGDYLFMSPPTTDLFAFGSGEFTIEMWIYRNVLGVQHDIIAFNPTSTNGAYIALYIGTDNLLYLYANNANRITGGTINTGTWYHIALARSGTSTKLFINGTQSGSTYTDSTVYLCGANRPIIGSAGFVVSGSYNGYIDDLRITKGIARYTQNFIPPSVALPRQ